MTQSGVEDLSRWDAAMRREMTLALSVATVSGIFAAVGAYDWLSSMADGAQPQQAAPVAMALTTVVVAKEPLGFGAVVTAEKLRTLDWPADSAPEGAYKTVADIFAEQETRSVLQTIQTDEPVLRAKITGPGQRASLSTMLRDGMKAVSVRVDEVVGVAGFVLPGDYVDVLVTFEKKGRDEREDLTFKPFTELLLQKLRVLAIDQTADPRQDGAKIARTVTLEANQVDAQKITLAATIGAVSLVLREHAAARTEVAQRRVNADDLVEDGGDKAETATLEPTIAVAPPPPPPPMIKLWRGTPAGIEPKDIPINRVRAAD